MHPVKENGQGVVFFQPDLSETTTLARAREFIDAGFRPTVFGFRRARYNRNYIAPWREVDLGRTQDARYWKRLMALIGAFPAIFRNRRLLKEAAVYLARNLDQLMLALMARSLFNRRAILVYEVVDIQPAFTRSNWRCGVMRLIERLCLAKVDLVVVSSPAFIHNYFAAWQGYRGEWLVVENKLRLAAPDISRAAQLRGRKKSISARKRWTIGYFGLIRGQATVELIVRLARRFPNLIDFKFRGVLTTVDEAWFRSAIAQADNIRYDGEFANPDDLAALYGGVDFAWALDLENVEANSRWLLPCRFYEAGLFGVPCLAVRDFEVGRLIDRLGVGWTFDHPLEESLCHFFEALDHISYERKRERLLALPTSTFVSESDSDILCQKLHRMIRLHAAAHPAIETPQKFGPENRVTIEPLEMD